MGYKAMQLESSSAMKQPTNNFVAQLRYSQPQSQQQPYGLHGVPGLALGGAQQSLGRGQAPGQPVSQYTGYPGNGSQAPYNSGGRAGTFPGVSGQLQNLGPGSAPGQGPGLGQVQGGKYGSVLNGRIGQQPRDPYDPQPSVRYT